MSLTPSQILFAFFCFCFDIKNLKVETGDISLASHLLRFSKENSLRELNHFDNDSRIVVKYIYHMSIFSELSIKSC